MTLLARRFGQIWALGYHCSDLILARQKSGWQKAQIFDDPLEWLVGRSRYAEESPC